MFSQREHFKTADNGERFLPQCKQRKQVFSWQLKNGWKNGLNLFSDDNKLSHQKRTLLLLICYVNIFKNVLIEQCVLFYDTFFLLIMKRHWTFFYFSYWYGVVFYLGRQIAMNNIHAQMRTHNFSPKCNALRNW